MEAVVFAAGLGTRLRPLTERLPKALVEVAGRPMLEHVIRRLIAAGADRIVINTHPFPEQIRRFLEATDFGVEILESYEPDGPLETGGGLKRAAALLRRDAPIILHNSDILTDFDLRAMYAAHAAADALATLAVADRATTRYFLFDETGLCGHEDRAKGTRRVVRESTGAVRPRAFGGVHVVAPELPSLLAEEGAFSIVGPYLRLAEEGRRIAAFEIGESTWVDIGSPAKLMEAEAAAARMAASV